MFTSSVKNIHENTIIQSPIKQKRSSKLIYRIKIRQSINKAKLLKYSKHSAPLISQVRRNSDIELRKLDLHLSENEDLKNLDKGKKLILLIAQLNGAHLNKNFNKNDLDNDILITMKKFLKLFEEYNFFFYFFCHYNISNETILKIIPHIRYIFFKKNELICKEGDECTKFYFLLKGKIAFIKKLMDGTELEHFTKEEEGFHFGQWEIANNRNNKYSILCKENSYLVYIPKTIFIKFIQDRYLKIENDIKNYLMNNLKNYLTIPSAKLERFVEKNVTPLFFRKNDIIFKKGEETKYLYLLYKGEINIIKNVDKGEESSFISARNNVSIESIQNEAKKINYKKMIKKNIQKDEESKNNLKLELTLNKIKYNIMTTLTKGSFIGLEIVTGVYFFKYTYVCKSDFVSILEINIENLDEHLKELMINLMPYFFRLDENLHQQMDKITFLNYNLQPKTFQKIRTRNKFNIYNKYIDSLKIEENEKSFLKQIKKIDKKFETNEAGFVTMNEKNLILQNKRNILVDKLRDNYFKSKSLNAFLQNFNKEKTNSLKYKNIKKMNYFKEQKNSINIDNNIRFKNNLLFSGNKKPMTFLIHEIKRKSYEKKSKIGDKPIENKFDKIFKRFKPRTATNSTIISKKIKNFKNFNLYDKEQKMDMEKKMNIIKNNKIQYTTFMKLQRNKNNIKDIKQGMSLDCKELVKKVYIRNNSYNDNRIYTVFMNKNKNYDSFNVANNTSKDLKNNISQTFIEGKKKIIIRNIFTKKDKKLNFYDTGIFDMPLATQLGLKRNKKL